MTADWLVLYPYHLTSALRWRFPNMLTRSEVYPHCKLIVFTFSNMLSQLRSVPWQKTDSVSTFYNIHTLLFTLFHDGKLTQFLHSPACFPVVKCSLTANWQFLHFPTCFPVVKCSVTENWLSFYTLQHTSLIVHIVSWRKTDSISTFSSMLPGF